MAGCYLCCGTIPHNLKLFKTLVKTYCLSGFSKTGNVGIQNIVKTVIATATNERPAFDPFYAIGFLKIYLNDLKSISF